MYQITTEIDHTWKKTATKFDFYLLYLWRVLFNLFKYNASSTLRFTVDPKHVKILHTSTVHTNKKR